MTVGWLDSVPDRWTVLPARVLFRERTEPSLPTDDHLTPSQTYGVVTQAEYMQITGNKVVLNLEGADRMKHVEPNDFIIHLRSFQGGIEHSGISGKVSLAYTVLTPLSRVEPRYFRWLLKSSGYIQELRVTTNQLRDGQSIKFANFASVPLPCPPITDQCRIADRLDRATTRIDILIGKQQQLIATLRERRVAVVTSAVRRGILQMHLRPSGVLHLGDVPSHWGTAPIRRLASTRAGSGFPPGMQGVEGEPIVFHKVRSLGSVTRTGHVTSPPDTISYETAQQLGAYVFPAGTLVIAKVGAALLLGRVGILTAPSCIDNNMVGITPNGAWLERFAFYSLSTIPFGYLVNPGAVPSLSDRNFMSYVLTVPPIKEQRQIVDHLDKQTAKIDALIGKAQRFIELSMERRSALITAAVTGQIDMRGESVGAA